MDELQRQAKKTLKGLTDIYDNDFLCGYEGDDAAELQLTFLKLIKEVAQLALDVRTCSRRHCVCSPENGIKRVMRSGGADLVERFVVRGSLTEIGSGTIHGTLAEAVRLADEKGGR